MKAGISNASRSVLRGGVILLIFLTILPSAGCVAQQPDLKQTERNLQQRIKQSNDESAQTRARQSQEILMLREQELPQLRGELERALHQAQELQGKQEDLKQRAVQLEQLTKQLEQLAGKMEAENTIRHTKIQESLKAQDMRNDVVIGTILLRMDDLEKRVKTLEKR
jgi:DNA repair exonuclease SbcCD ATPase subunit